jgi:hypothetical protein
MAKKMFNGKKGIAPLLVIGIFIIAMVVIYMFLFIPIPAFATIRNLINYILIILLWIIVQAIFILGYYYAGKYIVLGYKKYKIIFDNLVLKFQTFLMTRGR